MEVHLTRRRLLQTGTVAAAGAWAGLHPGLSRAASAVLSDPSAPSYLRRSSYAALDSTSFTTDSATLSLTGVGDVAADLQGADDAFSLMFAGDDSIQQGTIDISHPQLGSFEMFVVPVDQGGGTYQAIVNRTVQLPTDAPTSPAPTPVPTAPTATTATTVPPPAPLSLVSKLAAHRVSGGLSVALTVAPSVRHVRLWLKHGRTVLAVGECAAHGDHASARLHTRHRLAHGTYELIVATIDAHGAETIAPHALHL